MKHLKYIVLLSFAVLPLQDVLAQSFVSAQINAQRYANGAPSTCTTTSGGALTTQADCAFFQAVDAANAASANIDLQFGTGFYNECAMWVEPTGGWFVNIKGASMAGTTIVANCSHPTTPMMSSASGFPILSLRDITFYAGGNASSCFDLLGGATEGTIENVTCDNVATTAVSGVDHFLQIGSGTNYAQDLKIDNLVIGGAPAFVTSNASLTGVLSGTSLNSITINSGGGGYSSTYVTGIVNDPHNYCTTKPTFTATLTSGVVTGTTITAAGNCSAAPDLNVINQYAVTYGAKLYASDSQIDYFFPSVGITGAIVYGGNNTFYHAHPENLQFGIVNAQDTVYDGTECDTIYSACLIFQGLAGTSVVNTIGYTNKSNGISGSTVYNFASGAGDVNFGPQAILCSGGTPTDYQEFTGPTGVLVPGGTGWPAGTSIIGNDQSCGYFSAGQSVDYNPNLTLAKLNGATLLQSLYPWQTFNSGVWYTNNTGSENGSSNTGGNGFAMFMPFFVGKSTAFSGIGAWVVGAGSTGCLLRFAIYNTATTGLPGTVALDAGTTACTTAGAAASVTISQTLAPGLYWLAVATQGGPSTLPTIDGQYNNTPGVYNTTIQVASRGSYSQSGITGAFPTYTAGQSTSWFAPNLYLKAQ